MSLLISRCAVCAHMTTTAAAVRAILHTASCCVARCCLGSTAQGLVAAARTRVAGHTCLTPSRLECATIAALRFGSVAGKENEQAPRAKPPLCVCVCGSVEALAWRCL